ncbi:MAG: VacJ family lipoprotein [Rickettsiaceae bacterium]|nr:VacJ family lipoprotein [Rickettsiaceae bacterium]
MKKITLLLLITLFSQAIYAKESNYYFHYSLDQENQTDCSDLEDPFEKVNRRIFYFNSAIDRIFLKPIASVYGRVLSDFSKNRIGDFTDNIKEPLTTVNFILQLNVQNSFKSFWKFLINSTFGLGGTFDLSHRFKFKHKPQTFGSTLATYGVGPGPYIVLPIFGSTNMRDMWDIPTDHFLNPLMHKMTNPQQIGYSTLRVIHKRNEVMPFTNYIETASTDPYVAVRTALQQRREEEVKYPNGYKCGIRHKH